MKEAAKLGQICLETDFRRLPETAGERLYHKLGLTGIRGQVASGLPVVRELALPVYENALNQGKSANDAGVLTLLHLIATLEDTNLYHRGGEAGAAWAKAAAANLLPEVDMEQILELDRAFIRRNLSPGGCADLLAATIFLHKIRRLA